ncbi:membrane protein insertase YidC [Limibacter armeniacum]|uniref:membrane protein insertase YidC n=1 Tax=Limibacter armeniacum TaxID=466084 RepID=UPI002FE516BA
MDKNQTIGLVLLSGLLIAYMFFFSPDPAQLADNQVKTEQLADSANSTPKKEVTLSDSVLTQKFGSFAAGMKGESKEVVLENKDVKITFDTFGGKVKQVLLKNYVTYTKEPLVLLDETSSKVIEEVATDKGKIDLNSLYYQASKNGNSITFTLADSSNKMVSRTYSLADEGFVLNYSADLSGVNLKVPQVDFYWQNDMKRLEKGLTESRQRSTVNYYTTEEDFDYLSMSNSLQEETVEEPIRWVSSKQKFFNSALITDKKFTDLNITSQVNDDNDQVVKSTKIALAIPADGLSKDANLRYYFGPNEYHICETITPGFEKNVYLGWSLFAPLSKYIILPLFDFLDGFISNYGVIILIMVLIVKGLLFPLTYKSYLSMAKMRVLKPELDAIKEKHGDDMAKAQPEQMKLYQQAGVNPISGCIPMLAQMPVFLALFNFFPNAIQLRQQSFLWADDLSSYDSILNLPFEIPMYGDHVSLFTLLWAASTIVFTYYNNQMSSGMQNNQMKMVSYITPIFFLVFFNSYSSGLTYYYFISNLITIAQQVFSRNFIDEDKLKRMMEENKKKNVNKKKSGFQKRLEDAMKAQEDVAKQRKGKK